MTKEMAAYGGHGLYRGAYPGRPRGGATGPPVARRGGDRPLPRPWAGPPTGRPRGGDSTLSPVAGATGPLFSKDLVANLKKKLHLGPVAFWEGDRGYF